MNQPAALPRYGADQVGLISGFCFSADTVGQAIGSDEAMAWLQQPDNGTRFIWLHVNLAHAACERWLQTQVALPEAFFEMLHEGTSSTRIGYADQVLTAVINDVAFSFGTPSSDIATMWVCADSRLLVTARAKPLRSVDRLRAAVRRGEIFRSPLSLLVHLLQEQADVLVKIVRDTSMTVDGIEDTLLAQRLHDNRADLAVTRRTLVRMQRLLAPEPGSLFRLLNRPPRWLNELDVQELREATEEFSLVLNDLAALVERIKLLQEELAARLNEQSSRTLYTLTVVTVLALPINIVAGFFGMNVGGIPLAGNPHGFWLLVAIVAGFTVLTAHWAFRKKPGA